MTQNQANLFFIIQYAAVAVILFAAWHFHFSLDMRKSISRKTFLKRFLIVVGITLLGIAAMTGLYLLHLSPQVMPWAVGAVWLLMSVLGNTILFASWGQRCLSAPRGRELTAVVILLYMVADLFMPAGVKYAVVVVASGACLVASDQ